MPTLELDFVDDGDLDPQQQVVVVQSGTRIIPDGVEHWDPSSHLSTIAIGLYRADGSRIAGGG